MDAATFRDAPQLSPAKYAAALRDEHTQHPKSTKGERTRDRLKLAAVEALEEVGYRDMKVADITSRAGLALGSFYFHFQNKTEITVEVLKDFLASFSERRASDRPTSVYQAIYEANLAWIAGARANAGLLRCLLQLSDEHPEFAEVSELFGYHAYRRIADGLRRRMGESAPDEEALLLASYALGGMIDEICRKLAVSRDRHLAKLAHHVAPSDDHLAAFLSLIWYRALFGRDPEDEVLPAGARLLQVEPAPPRA